MNNHLNARLVLRTGLVVVVLAVCTHLVHGWQMQRHARGQLALAEQALEDGKGQEASAALGRYLVFRPGDPAVRTRYGLLLARQASTPRARRQALQVLRKVVPPRGGSLEARLEAARLAQALEEPADACKLLLPAVEAEPGSADLHERLGRAQALAGQLPAAIASLVRALELEPGRVSSAAELAELYRARLGQSGRALAVMDRLVKDNPRRAGAYLARARERVVQGKAEAAVADLAEARRLEPKDVDVLAASADLAHRRGLLADACTWWRLALESRPADATLVRGLVQAEIDRGQKDVALKVARQALARQPADDDLRVILAEVLLERGERADAEEMRRKLSTQGPQGRRLYLEGRQALAEGRPAQAALALEQALTAVDLPPGARAAALLALMQAHGEVGAWPEQVRVAQKALDETTTPAGRLRAARVLAEAGPPTSARGLAELRRLSQLTNPPGGVWNALARVLLEESVDRPTWQRNRAETERALARAERQPGEAVTAAVLRAEVLFASDEAPKARQVLERARDAHPDEPVLWRALAGLARRQGDEKRAQEVLAEADRHFALRPSWLAERAERLAREQGSRGLLQLAGLERSAEKLAAKERDGLLLHLAEIYGRLGHTQGVERLCKTLLARQPRQLRPRLLLLDAKALRNDEAAVARLLDEVEKQEGPGGAEWRCARATWTIRQAGLGRQVDLKQARRRLEEAQRLRPGWWRPLLLLGRLEDVEGRPEQARASYLKAWWQGARDPEALRRVVTLEVRAGRYREADRLLEQAERRGLLESGLYRPAAEIALKAGQAERASRLARLAVTERTYRDLLWLGRLLDGAGRHAEAGDVLAEAVQRGKELAEPWLALLAHHVRLRKSAEADACLAGMRANLPPQRLGQAEARAFEMLGRTGDAERAYRRILSAEPDDAGALRGLAGLYLRTDRPGLAEGVLRTLLEPRLLVPEEELPHLRRLLALVLKAEREEEALALVELNRRTEGDTEADRRVAALVRGSRPGQRAAALKLLEGLPGGPAVLPLERLRLAHLYEAERNWPAARAQYLALVAADEDNATYLALLVEGLLRAGKKAEAARWLGELEKREPAAARTKELRERLKKPAKK